MNVEIDQNFLSYLKKLISIMILSSSKQFNMFDKELERQEINQTAKDIVAISSLNVKIDNFNNYIVIQINPLVMITPRIKLLDVCKMINYGTLELRGTYLYSDIFSTVASTIDSIYMQYQLGV